MHWNVSGVVFRKLDGVNLMRCACGSARFCLHLLFAFCSGACWETGEGTISSGEYGIFLLFYILFSPDDSSRRKSLTTFTSSRDR